jgi:hypothetical protein
LLSDTFCKFFLIFSQEIANYILRGLLSNVALSRKARKMNTAVGFNNASSYGVNNKQNIGFCGTRSYAYKICDMGKMQTGGTISTSPREDYNLVRRVVKLVRGQNPNAKAKRVESYTTPEWKTIHSGLEDPYELLEPKVEVGTQHVFATKHSLRKSPSSVTIRLFEKVSPKEVKETNYTLYPKDTSPKSVARLNGLFA